MLTNGGGRGRRASFEWLHFPFRIFADVGPLSPNTTIQLHCSATVLCGMHTMLSLFWFRLELAMLTLLLLLLLLLSLLLLLFCN